MLNVENNKKYKKGTADITEFTLEEREINGEKVLIKVYQSKYDKYSERRGNIAKPKTKNGGKC